MDVLQSVIPMLADFDEETARDFDICLILHAEHSFNASTFAARVVASTHAHMYACIGAALAALSGELHGGANTQVMKMLIEIDKIERVEKWIRTKFDAGEKIMGMGHAVYKTMDSRARILRTISEKMAKRTGNTKWFELSRKIDSVSRDEFERRKTAFAILICNPLTFACLQASHLAM